MTISINDAKNLIENCIDWLINFGLLQDSIFLKDYEVNRISALLPRDLPQINKADDVQKKINSIYYVATLLKCTLKALPEPLMTFKMYKSWVDSGEDCDTEVIQKRLLQLPEINREILKNICIFLKQVGSNQSENHMVTEKLASIFGPIFVCPKEPLEELDLAVFNKTRISNLLVTLIDSCQNVFKDQDDLDPLDTPTQGGKRISKTDKMRANIKIKRSQNIELTLGDAEVDNKIRLTILRHFSLEELITLACVCRSWTWTTCEVHLERIPHQLYSIRQDLCHLTINHSVHSLYHTPPFPRVRSTIRYQRMKSTLDQLEEAMRDFPQMLSKNIAHVMSMCYDVSERRPYFRNTDQLRHAVRKLYSLSGKMRKIVLELVELGMIQKQINNYAYNIDNADETSFKHYLEDLLFRNHSPQGVDLNPSQQEFINKVICSVTILCSPVIRVTIQRGLKDFAKGVAKRLAPFIFSENGKSRVINDNAIITALTQRRQAGWREDTKIRLIKDKYGNLDNLLKDPVRELESLKIKIDGVDDFSLTKSAAEKSSEICEKITQFFLGITRKGVLLRESLDHIPPLGLPPVAKEYDIVNHAGKPLTIRPTRQLLEEYAERRRQGKTWESLPDYLREKCLSNEPDTTLIVDCSDMNLTGINLYEADLRGCRFDRANLSYASLCRANLEGASFEGATLCHAELQGAVLEKVNFQNAKVVGVEKTQLPPKQRENKRSREKVEKYRKMICVVENLLEEGKDNPKYNQDLYPTLIAHVKNLLRCIQQISFSTLSDPELDFFLKLKEEMTIKQIRGDFDQLRNDMKLKTNKDDCTKLIQRFLERYTEFLSAYLGTVWSDDREPLVDMSMINFANVDLTDINLTGILLNPYNLVHTTCLNKSKGLDPKLRHEIQTQKFKYAHNRLRTTGFGLDECATLIQEIPHMDALVCNGTPPDLGALSDTQIKVVGWIALMSSPINRFEQNHPLYSGHDRSGTLTDFLEKSDAENVKKQINEILNHRNYQLNKEVVSLNYCSKIYVFYDHISQSSLELGDIRRLFLDDLLPEDQVTIQDIMQQLADRRQALLSKKDEELITADQKYIDSTLEDLDKPVDRFVDWDDSTTPLPGPVRRVARVLSHVQQTLELKCYSSNVLIVDFRPHNLESVDFDKIEVPINVNIFVTLEQFYKVLAPRQQQQRMLEFQKVIKKGDIEGVKKWLDLGVSINEKAPDDRTPLMDACFNEHYEIAKLLLKKGADVNITTASGFFIIESLCDGSIESERSRTKKMISLLVQYGATLDLHSAVVFGDFQSVKYFVKQSANPIEHLNSSSHGNGPLHLAARNGHERLVAFLLEKRANPSLENAEEKTPFEIACEKGYLKIAEMLINTYIVDLRQSKKDSLLLMVAQNGYVSLVEHFIKYKATVNTKTAVLLEQEKYLSKYVEVSSINKPFDSEMRMLLHLAVEHNKKISTKWLLQHGANINATMSLGRTPLMLACQKGYFEIVQILVAHDRTSLNHRIHKHWPPLWVTVSKGHTDIVKFLLESGADPNCQYCNKSSLHEAVRKNHIGIAKLLLNAGHHPEGITGSMISFDVDNNLPIHIACKEGNKQMIHMLLSAPLFRKNRRDEIPLDLLPNDSDSEELRKWASKSPLNTMKKNQPL